MKRLFFAQHTSQQSGLSLIELMIALALGSLLVLGITRYAIDAMQTQRTTADLANNQDAVRITLEKIRMDIQRAGFFGCNNVTAVEPFTASVSQGSNANSDGIDWAERQMRLETIEFSGNNITAAYLTPLLEGGTDITIADNRTTLSIPNDAGVSFSARVASDENLILANCFDMELIDPPAVAEGATSFTLNTAVNGAFFNRTTGQQKPNTKLYVYRETLYTFDNATNTLSFNGDDLIDNIANDGYTVTENGVQRPIINIQIDLTDNLRAEGAYSTNVQARNKGI